MRHGCLERRRGCDPDAAGTGKDGPFKHQSRTRPRDRDSAYEQHPDGCKNSPNRACRRPIGAVETTFEERSFEPC
jgi:hypothetical protein